MPFRHFTVPRDIFYGPGALEVLGTLQGERILIVTDIGVRKLGLLGRVENILGARKAEIMVFDRIEAEPSEHTVHDVLSTAREFKPDLFIGLGGGSPIDAGKAAWVLYEYPDLAGLTLMEIARELPRRPLRHQARYVAISTTSGTGSEATTYAVINSHQVEPPIRVVLRAPHLVPDVAITDSELASSMPPGLTANTGFDALVHAMESYVLTPQSDMVDSLAIAAARTVWEWLPRAVANGKDMPARDKMHMAALQAGMAFSNGRLGLVHVTADQMAVAFDIPHGLTCALMLCPALAFLYSGYRARLDSLAVSLGMAGTDDRARVNNLLSGLDQFKNKVGIPVSIKDTGLEEDRFQAKLDLMASGYMDRVSPVSSRLKPDARRAAGIPESVTEVKELFIQAWNGTRAKLS